MARWKPLPEELDPQVREFAGQLRRLVDRSGLSIAAVSDRTGYSKTSWERYLNGRLLAPKRAIIALAEATGTDPVHLTTMWELAERAWSRSEMRHDMTMEAIRITQARAALGGYTPPQGIDLGHRAPKAGAHAKVNGADGRGARGGAPAGVREAPPIPSVPRQPGPPGAPVPPVPLPGPDASGGAGGKGSAGGKGGKGGKGKRLPLILTGVGAAVALIAAGFALPDSGDEPAPQPTAKPTETAQQLPAGVKCAGADCTGQDPEEMGCAGQQAVTSATATVGTTVVEIRYSKTCEAAWARITQAAVGDEIAIDVGTEAQEGAKVTTAFDAYTAMLAVENPADAKACATLATGTTGCTTPTP
ncbi:helix-turn-helix domain-containing protein [Streptomyces sp. BBFR102]|uniref:helix-turn-helix domain-containing protein n=1 Tax=Streptomyces sp. BBFR102 TaxID=3448171 RepID=UPI003F529E70